jgi:hypothetical protein
MITASGAEGINLRNTRYVHVLEPYWHMVRIEQVVGRARRICSHQDLPEALRTVQVFFYVARFSPDQRTNDKYKELRLRDVSRRDPNRPVTTDESLLELAQIKYDINRHILNAMKGTAMDCHVYRKGSDDYTCYSVGAVTSKEFVSHPTLTYDLDERPAQKKTQVTLVAFQYRKQRYYANADRTEIYDEDQVKASKAQGGVPLVSIGTCVDGKPVFR